MAMIVHDTSDAKVVLHSCTNHMHGQIFQDDHGNIDAHQFPFNLLNVSCRSGSVADTICACGYIVDA